MHLDLPTLMFAGSLVAAISSVLLVFTWWQRPECDRSALVGGGQLCRSPSALSFTRSRATASGLRTTVSSRSRSSTSPRR